MKKPSFDDWMKKRDRDLYEEIKNEGVFDFLFGKSTPSQQANKSPSQQANKPLSNREPMPLQPAKPKEYKTDHLIKNAKENLVALMKHIQSTYGHSSRVKTALQQLKAGWQPVEGWWTAVKQHTDNVLKTGGQSALDNMRADQKVTRTLHQGMQDYKKQGKDLDLRRQSGPGGGMVGNGNDQTVSDLLGQNFNQAPTSLPLEMNPIDPATKKPMRVGPVAARRMAN